MTSGQAHQGRANPMRALLWAAAASLLPIPAVAMHFTDEVRWDAMDFAVAAGMIASAGLALELLLRRSSGWTYKATAIIAVLAVFAMVWVNLAVGIIGKEGGPAGWAFVGVATLAIGAGLFVIKRRAR